MPGPSSAVPALAVAAGFLTRLPVGRRAVPADDLLLRAAPLFPLVGAALGAAVAGVALAAALALPPLAAGALAVAFELAVTGALHADGLADSADGLGGRDREQSLAIMRDHSLGAYGGAALALDLLLKATALGVLAEDSAVLPVVAAFALSRAVALPLAAALPYARAGAGTGRLLDGAGAGPAAAGVVVACAIAAVAVRLDAVALIVCVAAVTVLVGLLARRRLGGVTGDVMGAAIELSATCALLVAVGFDA
jgi:adenosylcobinamide-GDP ribazoletransferase